MTSALPTYVQGGRLHEVYIPRYPERNLSFYDLWSMYDPAVGSWIDRYKLSRAEKTRVAPGGTVAKVPRIVFLSEPAFVSETTYLIIAGLVSALICTVIFWEVVSQCYLCTSQ